MQQSFSKHLFFYSTWSSFTRVSSVAHSSFWEVLIPKARKDEARQLKSENKLTKGVTNVIVADLRGLLTFR